MTTENKKSPGRKFNALMIITAQTTAFYAACAYKAELVALVAVQISLLAIFAAFMGANAYAKKFPTPPAK